MPIADVYTARSGSFATGVITTAQPFQSLTCLTTKRAWVVGVRVDCGVTTAAAGNWYLFQLARPGNTATATGGAAANPHDFYAAASISLNATAWSTAPTVGVILWEQALPQTTGSSWEEFPPSGYEWGVPPIATGSANAGLHSFVTQSVGTTGAVYADLIFSE